MLLHDMYLTEDKQLAVVYSALSRSLMWLAIGAFPYRDHVGRLLSEE